MRCLVLAMLALLTVCDQPALAASPQYSGPTYTVKDGIKVDRLTYKGFLYYGDQCERCHGPEGMGGSYAPDLTDSMRKLDHDKFTGVIKDGRKNMTTAVHNVMPAFRPNPDVMENLENIYRYLKARSDGALRRGHPEHLEN